jgi:hypothetical protein
MKTSETVVRQIHASNNLLGRAPTGLAMAIPVGGKSSAIAVKKSRAGDQV